MTYEFFEFEFVEDCLWTRKWKRIPFGTEAARRVGFHGNICKKRLNYLCQESQNNSKN